MVRPYRYVFELIADLIVLAVIGGYLLATIALNYKGRCGVFWFFGGEGHPCSRSEYMKEEAGFLLFGILGLPEVWVPILLVLAVPSAHRLSDRPSPTEKISDDVRACPAHKHRRMPLT